MDCSPPGSSVHGSLQERVPDWAAMSSSRGSSQPRDGTQVSRITGGFLIVWATRGVLPPPLFPPLSPAVRPLVKTTEGPQQFQASGLPRWLNSTEPACQSRRHGVGAWVPRAAWSNWACSPQPPSLCPGAWEPQLLKPASPRALLCTRRVALAIGA